MDEQLTADLTRIFRAITIHSPAAFSFAGRLIAEPAPAPDALPTLVPAQRGIESLLQSYLYQYCYCHRFTGQLPDEAPQSPAEEGFPQALSQANQGQERFDPGWQIAHILPSSQIVAYKQGLTRVLWPGEFITHDGPEMMPRVGSAISIFVPKESLTVQPGFYYAFGVPAVEHDFASALVRIYCNVSAAGATHVLHICTRALNRYEVPYRFKCASSAAVFTRRDAAVLYVGKRFSRIALALLADVYHRLEPYLEPDTPLFAKPLARGLALAEDPGNGESFGMHRCRLLAEAIWQAYEQGLQTEQGRLQALATHFARSGIVPASPYLQAGSLDEYTWPALAGTVP